MNTSNIADCILHACEQSDKELIVAIRKAVYTCTDKNIHTWNIVYMHDKSHLCNTYPTISPTTYASYSYIYKLTSLWVQRELHRAASATVCLHSADKQHKSTSSLTPVMPAVGLLAAWLLVLILRYINAVPRYLGNFLNSSAYSYWIATDE